MSEQEGEEGTMEAGVKASSVKQDFMGLWAL